MHGVTADGLSWARVAHHLAGRVTLAAPIHAAGAAAAACRPYGIAGHTDDMAAVVDEPSVGRVVPTGHSMGPSPRASPWPSPPYATPTC